MKLIPNLISGGTPRSETVVFKAFRNSSLEGYLLHSLGIPRSEKNREREVDFFYVCSDGIFIIEVKGGKISIENGKWYSTNYFGTKHLINDPFKQAQSAAHLLRTKLVQIFPWVEEVTIESIVCFPDTLNAVSTFEYDDRKVIRSKDLYRWDTLDNKMLHITRKYRKLYNKRELTPPEMKKIAEFLRPDFEGKADYKNATTLMHQRLIELSDQQNEIFEQFTQNPRILVNGVAGSGKTLLALSSFRQRTSRAGSTLLLCYNRLLSEDLKSNFKKSDYTYKGYKSKISTIDSHILEGLYHYADIDKEFSKKIELINNSDDQDYASKQRRLANLYGEIPYNHIQKYDYIILDEAQDIILDQNYFEIVSMSLKKGIKNGNWSMFADSNQNIFHERQHNLADILQANDIQYSVWNLSKNMRSTNQIGSLIKSYSNITCETSGIDGPSVKFLDIGITNNAGLHNELKQLFESGFMPEQITFLATTHAHLELFEKMQLKTIPIVPYSVLSTSALDDTKTISSIRYSTVHKFKGLENDVVILTVDKENEQPGSYYSKILYYIGVTRARFLLIVLYINK